MILPDIQAKTRFEVEYPINASPKILFPYLATASGLTQWFCDDVRYEGPQRLNFVWDKEDHYAELTSQRLNKNVRFVFLNEQRQSEANATFLEFSLGASGITDEVFLHIVDYSPSESDEDKREMWDGLVDKLREQVGG